MTPSDKLQPYRTPGPKRPFVNRDAELHFIGDKLRSGCQGEAMSMVVTCFWGTFGIGKSWLLQELERRCQYGKTEAQGSCPALAARLDMSAQAVPSLWRGERLDVKQVIKELWKQLASQKKVAVPDLNQMSAEELAGAFVDQVTAWLAHATPVVLLDTMDDVVREDEAAFFWLEEHLVERLALTDRVLFVFASRGELRRWQRFQVRRRVDSYPLTPFEIEIAGRAVGANLVASKAFYRHAFGHPLATEYLGRMLEKKGINLELATQEEVEAALEPSIVRVALDEVARQILAKVPEPLAQLAQYISVLRWVNVEPLQHLMKQLNLPGARERDAYYLNLIGQLQTHRLLYWNTDRANYEIAPAIRRILAHSLELDDAPDFSQAHFAAYDYHRNHLERFSQYLARYVPELAYHCTMLTRGSFSGETPSFGVWWEHFLAKHPQPDPASWKELSDALEQDIELRETLPVEEHNRLLSDARARAAALPS